MIRICPKRDAICPHGMSCQYTIDRYECETEPRKIHPMTTPQTDAPERIWAVHWNTYGAVLNGAWADTVRHFGGGVEYVRADMIENWRREIVLRHLSKAKQAADTIDAHEATIAALVEALRECEAEIDGYIKQEYPHDHPVQERCRQRDFAANPARIALTKAIGDK